MDPRLRGDDTLKEFGATASPGSRTRAILLKNA